PRSHTPHFLQRYNKIKIIKIKIKVKIKKIRFFEIAWVDPAMNWAC
ncbi:hypothetical protein HMPREF1421_01363, partial [Helicobacter pylori GAM265BSii]